MKRVLPFALLLALVAVIASASCLLTRHYLSRAPQAAANSAQPELFEQLGLTPAQEQKINVIRARFAAQQHHCLALMQQRNRELAAVITSDRADSPRVQAAVEKIHEAMGDLQKATLTSVFAAREVLTPAQYDRLLELVAAQLSADGGHACCR
jgi:Spy/CpxP family protein refolding chaperone